MRRRGKMAREKSVKSQGISFQIKNGHPAFISMINTTFESLKARKVFTFKHFSCYEYLKFYAQLS